MRTLRRFLVGYAIGGIMMALLVLVYILYQPADTATQDIQDISDNTPISGESFITYLAPDQSGILQVWRYSQGESTQLTDVGDPVTQYDLQGNTLVYVSNQALWVHMPGANIPARTLATLSLPEYGGEYAYAFPQISPDESTIIYANNGLYRVALENGTPELLLEDVQLSQQASDPGAVRIYQESQFINADTLLLHVGIWESRLPAVYDLRTGNYSESEPYAYPAAYPLSDDRLLYYGNSFRGMLSGLYVAPSDNVADVTPVIGGDYGGVLPVENTIVLAVTETSLGQVRLLVTWLPTEAVNVPGSAIIDVNLANNTATLVRELTPDSASQSLSAPEFTLDGTAFIGMIEAEYRTDIYSGGAMVGKIARYDIASDSLEVLVDSDAMAIQQHTR